MNTLKSNQQYIRHVENKENLKLDYYNLFELSTHPDDSDDPVYIYAPYDFETFDVICAYIQFNAFEVDENYGMSETDVIEILIEFYDCSLESDCGHVDVYYMDLFENWEHFCGQYDEVLYSTMG